MMRILFSAIALMATPVAAQEFDPWPEYDEVRLTSIAAGSERPEAPQAALDLAPHAYGAPSGNPFSRPSVRPVLPHQIPLAVRPLPRSPEIPQIAARHRIKTALASPEYPDALKGDEWGEMLDGWFFGVRRMTPLHADVSIAAQTLTLYRDGVQVAIWPVSTGLAGYASTRGTFKVTFLSRNHVSSIYKAPMPCAIFYNGGEAIHATGDVRNLGRTASHGCVRLERSNACSLFDEVARTGEDSLTVNVF